MEFLPPAWTRGESSNDDLISAFEPNIPFHILAFDYFFIVEFQLF